MLFGLRGERDALEHQQVGAEEDGFVYYLTCGLVFD